jgi:outer membrane immunogenic protein
MKPLLLATAVALATAAVPAAAQDWSGPYIGHHFGYSTLAEDEDETLLFDTNRDGTYGDTVNTSAPANAFSPGFCAGSPKGNNAAAGCDDDEDTPAFGVRLGYDWQAGNWVYGVVGEIELTDLSDSVTGFSTTPAAYHFRREIDSVAALRGRLGYTMNDWLGYATAGLARAEINRLYDTTNVANSFTPTGGSDGDGYQVGLGVERKMGSDWSVGVEYLYTSLKDEDYVVAVGPGTAGLTNPFRIVNPSGTDMIRSSDKFDNHSVRVAVSYRFGM